MLLRYLAAPCLVITFLNMSCGSKSDSGTNGAAQAGSLPGDTPATPSGTIASADAKTLVGAKGTIYKFAEDFYIFSNLTTADLNLSNVNSNLRDQNDFFQNSIERNFKLNFSNFVQSPVIYSADSELPCDPKKTGDTTDVDSDKFTKELSTQTFDCDTTDLLKKQIESNKAISDLKVKAALAGTTSFFDQDDAKKFPLSGGTKNIKDLKIAVDISATILGKKWEFSSNSISNREANANINNQKITVTIKEGAYRKATELEDGNANKDKNYETNSSTWLTTVFTPTDMSKASLGGTIDMKGYLAHSDPAKGAVTFKVSSENLVYGGCTSSNTKSAIYKSGSITFEDGSKNKIKLSYDNCTLAKKYNEESL